MSITDAIKRVRQLSGWRRSVRGISLFVATVHYSSRLGEYGPVAPGNDMLGIFMSEKGAKRAFKRWIKDRDWAKGPSMHLEPMKVRA